MCKYVVKLRKTWGGQQLPLEKRMSSASDKKNHPKKIKLC